MPRVVPSEAVAVIHELFPFTATQVDQPQDHQTFHVGHAVAVAALVAVVDEIPSELIVLEGREHAAFVAGMAILRNAILTWQGPRAHNVTYIPGFGSLNPATVIRRALEKCPSEAVAPGTSELPFLGGDPKLQENLRLDLSHAERALVNGEWKAATVLAGSVLEALLFWALSHARYHAGALAAKSVPKKPLDEWHLSHYIAAAEELGLIFTPDTITEAKLAQNYRNLIHPGREARLGQRCDKGTAQVAAAAVAHVIADLATRFPTP